ncbi:MAG TPA: tetratricopeptide repeat protein [Phycisphaerae bacterium]|nr:tetratricopeptide repeat protein [Phycisphaerae bacterium]HUT62028.1 tetratricopeptide repeat protein [Phycisphaerae bacterium]
MHRRTQLVVWSLAALFACPALAADTPSEMLENGIYTEQTVGDLDAAIVIYKKVLAHDKAGDEQKAQAQFRLGMCYMKKRNADEARKAFQAVVQNHPRQKELVTQAQTRLLRLASPNPATLMPPETLAYFEVGSPGEQVAKIVNMLKGTPLANPLQVIGARKGATTKGSGEKTPADIIAALLNPSMLEEFKKIRGMAVGVLGVEGRTAPPMVAVLYPGESDALKGLVTAGLLMAGRQGEAMEGMQTVAIQEIGGICAYDENVVIAVTADSQDNARKQLAWCVRQYKGLSKDPSLATKNESFARLTSPQARQKDALTVWVNPARIFQEFDKQFASADRRRTRVPTEFLTAKEILDAQNIDGLVMRVVLDETAPFIEVSAAFKEGHQCLGYDLIRTPPLTQRAFEGVPLDAVALVSFALGDAQRSEQAARAAGQAVQRFAGLDLGRELFANIEQVNIFAVPPSEDAARSPLAKMTHPLVPCLGVSLTSHNPAKTRQVVDRLLSVPSMILTAMGQRDQKDTEPVPPNMTRYMIGQSSRYETVVREIDGKKRTVGKRVSVAIHCYMGQAGRSTVLSLNPKVVAAAVAAVGADDGALASTPIRGRLAEIPEGTCKLVMVNAGGIARFAAVDLSRRSSSRARTRPAWQGKLKAMDRLAEVLDKTYVTFHTVEEPNFLTARIGLKGLPPLGELFPLVMQIMR